MKGPWTVLFCYDCSEPITPKEAVKWDGKVLCHECAEFYLPNMKATIQQFKS